MFFNENKKIFCIIISLTVFYALLNANTRASLPHLENDLIIAKLLVPDSIYRIRKVVIDAGHGGKDSGCLGYSKTQEKDITLKIALLLGKKIKNNFPNIQIIYTRDKDFFVPLDERAHIANRNQADLFISIHCNFLPGHSSYSGAETYVLGLHRSKENLEVARRENAAVILEDNYQKRYKGYDWASPEANIIITAWQASYLDRSTTLAASIQSQLGKVANRKNLGVKQAGFLVLRETTMPSVLIETGFLSNPAEERYLRSAEGQEAEADAMYKAFLNYKKTVENGIHTSNFNALPTAINSETNSMDIATNEQSSIPLAKGVEFTPKGVKSKKEVSQKAISFKVQLLTSPKEINTSKDPKWTKANEVEIRKENDIFKYLAVGFTSYEDALQGARALNKVGFIGAFVVAYEGEERIDVKLAQEKLKK